MTTLDTSTYYRIFGLTVRTAKVLPSLQGAEISTVATNDVSIVWDRVVLPEEMKDVGDLRVARVGGSIFLQIDMVGQFEIRQGRFVIIDADPRASDSEVQAYLLGSVFGTLLHQRGNLPMHCNAIEMPHGVHLFCGDSGAGKSTLAAFFEARGYPLLTDDLCALSIGAEGPVMAWAGIPRLKLCQPSITLLDRDMSEASRVAWSSDKYEFTRESVSSETREVVALYHLQETGPDRSPGIHRLRGIELANAITANVYRRRVADLIGAAPFYMAAIARIARDIPVWTVNRRWGLEWFEEEALEIERHMSVSRSQMHAAC